MVCRRGEWGRRHGGRVGSLSTRGVWKIDNRRRRDRRVLAEHQAIAERLRANPEAVRALAVDNLARWSKEYGSRRRPGWLVRWEDLLAGPPDHLLDMLNAETEEAIRLRRSSPFLGILTFKERLEILKTIDPELAKAVEAFKT